MRKKIVAKKRFPEDVITGIVAARAILAAYSEIQIQEVQLFQLSRKHLIDLWYDSPIGEFNLADEMKELKTDWINEAVKNEIMDSHDFDKILNALDNLASYNACL